ncbi:MAG: Ku protein [Bacillota bacterium]
MRTLWKGAITFGLVHIPVRVYPATENKGVKFRYLHRECKTPVRYVKHCPTCRREVASEEIVSGYEYEKGQFVVLADEDFERLPTAEAKVVDIVDFVHISEIDPILFDKSYYLEPADGGAKAYALLRRAMLDTGRIAVARVALRARQHLAAVRVFDGVVLVMETMYWPDEVRPWTGLEGLQVEPAFHENEIRMAEMLVNSLTAPFNPAKYTDDYRSALHELIRAKVEGREIYAYREPETAKVVDLMEALRASVEMAQVTRWAGPGAAAGGVGGPSGAAGRPPEGFGGQPEAPREPGGPGG